MSHPKVIFKYSLPRGTEFFHEMPKGAKILSARFQRGIVCFWAEVDSPNNRSNDKGDFERRVFIVLPTGFDYTDREGYCRQFIDTVTSDDGGYVLHVFEIVPEVVEPEDTSEIQEYLKELDLSVTVAKIKPAVEQW